MVRTQGLLYRLHIDAPLMSSVVVVCALGLVVLYSAADQSTDIIIKQAIRMLVGLLAMILIAQVSPQRLERWAPLIYLVGLGLLLLVFFVGTGRGAQRWLDLGLFQLQPSELMKLAVPVTVAGFVAQKVLPPHIGTTHSLLRMHRWTCRKLRSP